MWWDEGREDVVAAVARGAVAVVPGVVGGEEGLEDGEEVVVAARAGLQDGDARGGVGDEDVEEAVAVGPPPRRGSSRSRR